MAVVLLTGSAVRRRGRTSTSTCSRQASHAPASTRATCAAPPRSSTASRATSRHALLVRKPEELGSRSRIPGSSSPKRARATTAPTGSSSSRRQRSARERRGDLGRRGSGLQAGAERRRARASSCGAGPIPSLPEGPRPRVPAQRRSRRSLLVDRRRRRTSGCAFSTTGRVAAELGLVAARSSRASCRWRWRSRSRCWLRRPQERTWRASELPALRAAGALPLRPIDLEQTLLEPEEEEGEDDAGEDEGRGSRRARPSAECVDAQRRSAISTLAARSGSRRATSTRCAASAVRALREPLRSRIRTCEAGMPMKRRSEGVVLVVVVFFVAAPGEQRRDVPAPSALDAMIVRNRDARARAEALARGGVQLATALLLEDKLARGRRPARVDDRQRAVGARLAASRSRSATATLRLEIEDAGREAQPEQRAGRRRATALQRPNDRAAAASAPGQGDRGDPVPPEREALRPGGAGREPDRLPRRGRRRASAAGPRTRSTSSATRRRAPRTARCSRSTSCALVEGFDGPLVECAAAVRDGLPVRRRRRGQPEHRPARGCWRCSTSTTAWTCGCARRGRRSARSCASGRPGAPSAATEPKWRGLHADSARS